MTGRRFPDGYRPLAYCSSCGRDFSGDTLFDHHRTGVHAYTFAEGLRRSPPVDDGRRCLDAEEMLERGWRPLTDQEMVASARHRHRAGFGVELWFDPAAAERVRRTHAGVPLSGPPNGVEAIGEQLAIEEPPAA